MGQWRLVAAMTERGLAGYAVSLLFHPVGWGHCAA